MIKSKNVSNHITITLTKDEMVYLQSVAYLDFNGSTSSLASFIVRRFIHDKRCF